MLNQKIIDRIIPILKKDVRRVLRMKVRGFPKPYFASFVLRDTHWFNTWASSGSTFRRRSDRSRHVFCDVRVGSYRYDQIADGGLIEDEEERESENYGNVPIDDYDLDGLRMGLWRLSESKFREALSDYSDKESARISKIDPNSKFKSFSKGKPIVSKSYRRPEFVDEEKWVRFCKNASIWMNELPHLSSSWVDFDVTQETKILVNTEGSVIVQHMQIFTLSATFRKLTKEGSHLERELVVNCASQDELPDFKQFKKLAWHKYQQLMRSARAKIIHSFSGPVLLHPGPAGLLFHEAIGHRLEGSRLLSSGEGQTFKGQVGKSVIGLPLSIRDNPKLKRFDGKRCIGAYDYDDEGTPAGESTMVEDGILRGFLTTRSAISTNGHLSNGHARNKKLQRPISRMAVTIIEGHSTLTLDDMKDLLIEEIKEQGKPFGMIVYETEGGETETTRYDFQAFSGEIGYATLVYADGHEKCVRGVNFVGTPLQALSNITAVSNKQEVDNHYCGAESGMIPVTTISPAVLLKNLELQAKEEELVTPYVLPRPQLKKPKRILDSRSNKKRHGRKRPGKR